MPQIISFLAVHLVCRAEDVAVLSSHVLGSFQEGWPGKPMPLCQCAFGISLRNLRLRTTCRAYLCSSSAMLSLKSRCRASARLLSCSCSCSRTAASSCRALSACDCTLAISAWQNALQLIYLQQRQRQNPSLSKRCVPLLHEGLACLW